MSNAMIVAPPPDAVATGAIVLKVESNAVDAAVACAFVQTVVALLINILSHNCEHLYKWHVSWACEASSVLFVKP
jgi:hypothetical protein